MLRRERQAVITAVVAASVVCGAIMLADNGSDGTASAMPPPSINAGSSGDTASNTDSTDPSSDVASVDGVATGSAALAPATTAAPAGTATADAPTASQDLGGEDLTSSDGCVMDKTSVRLGESGQAVSCVQQALILSGYMTGSASGQFDQSTFEAAEKMQADRNLYVDGIIGRESAISLGVWPDEQSFVTRTPPPPPGAVDLMGYPLSTVASAGDNAPPVPPNSGSGRRIVYDRSGQRVWAIGNDGRTIRSWLVSGSKYSNEVPGVHEVYSRSEMSTAWNGKAWLPHMVRWLDTERGAIGFHGIPLHVADNTPYQTEKELGTRLSGGCQRQANRDADFMWDFAQIGTPVIVL